MSELYIPPSASSELLRRAAEQAAQQGDELLLSDGRRFKLADMNDPLVKSMEEARAARIPYRMNPLFYGWGAYQGVKDIQHAVVQTNKLLRQVPAKNPVVAAAIRKRQSQAGNWGRRPRFKGDTGMQVVQKDSRKAPSGAAKQRAREIEDILLHGGIRVPHPRTGQPGCWNAEGSQKAMGLQNALRALVWDSLVLDAAAIEIQPGINSKKYPVAYWNPIDAAEVRFAVPKDSGRHASRRSMWGGAGTTPYLPEIREETRDIAFVQMNPTGMGVLKEFAWNECGYLVRNHRTDEWVMGYGYPEIEMLVDIITGILYGIRFNVDWFDKNHIPEGILSIAGNYSDTILDDFRRQLRLMSGGPGQWWRMPILAAEGQTQSATYIPLRGDAGEGGMYWKEWVLFCTTITCALFQMDASEINFVNFGTSSNALANPAPETKIAYAQESGLEPLLQSLGTYFNENIVEQIDPDFCLEWVGLSERDLAAELEFSSHRMVNAMSTPNRELARMDERPIYDPLDPELWDACRQQITGQDADFLDEDEIEDLVVKLYREQGGQFALWPDAPVGNPAALQLWQMEHNMQQMAPGMADPTMMGDPSMMGGDPNAPGADASGQFQGPPPRPGQGQGPAPSDREGPDTHIGDVGAMLLRRSGAPQGIPGGAIEAAVPAISSMRKSIEVIVRRASAEGE